MISIEAGRELDPTNPDTDGDGTADGIELTLGTNPLDPASGGLGPVAGIVPILPSGQLILDNITKTVGGDHMASIPVGSEVTFTITAEAYLRGNIISAYIRTDCCASCTGNTTLKTRRHGSRGGTGNVVYALSAPGVMSHGACRG